MVNICRVSLRDHQRFGHAPPRTGNQLGRNVPGTTYRCAPGGPNDYVFIYAQPQMWPAVLDVLHRPELAQDPRFKTLEARWENRTALDAIIDDWTRRRDKHEVMRLMGEGRRALWRLPGYRRGAGRPAPQGPRDDRRRRLPAAGHLSNRRLPRETVGLARQRPSPTAARRAYRYTAWRSCAILPPAELQRLHKEGIA